ncbi:MAG: hypothetical protein HC890_08085 [Chloroflexaceae bacterium]|nr:hypothetical protein [Chloroflexaceae bacterium]
MLDAASLEAIAQEARNCFLYEDAPDFLTLLVEGLERLRTAYAKGSSNLEEIHKDLIRAAHSLKGGSGMAQMPILNGLTHRLEDLFEAMADNRVKDLKTALELAILAMEEAAASWRR